MRIYKNRSIFQELRRKHKKRRKKLNKNLIVVDLGFPNSTESKQLFSIGEFPKTRYLIHIRTYVNMMRNLYSIHILIRFVDFFFFLIFISLMTETKQMQKRLTLEYVIQSNMLSQHQSTLRIHLSINSLS